MTVRVLVLTAATVVAVLCACSDDKTDASAADGVSAGDACPLLRRKEGGECCPPGAYYDHDGDACHPVGPLSCAAVLPDKPEDCRPRWCWRLRTAADAPCAAIGEDCWPQPAPCTPENGGLDAGCEAGSWRPDPKGPCRHAGAHSVAAVESAQPKVEVTGPAGAPRPGALPKPADTRFCRDASTGRARICAPAEKGCGPGKMPTADGKDCEHVGAGFVCPAGFVTHGGDDKLAPTCVADVKACPSGKWPKLSPAAEAVYVDVNAEVGGDGTEAKPYRLLATAATKAKSGATLVLAGGQHVAPVAFTRRLHIRGVCAAKVTVVPPTGPKAVAAIWVVAKEPLGELGISGVTAAGDLRGVHVEGQATLRLRGVWIRDVRGVGLRAWRQGASFVAEDTVITGVKLDAMKIGYPGYGVMVDEGAYGRLVRSFIGHSRSVGVHARNPKTTLLLERVRVNNTVGEEATAAVLVRDGVDVVMRSVSLDVVDGDGIYADCGPRLRVRGMVISNTHRAKKRDSGACIIHFHAATTTIDGLRCDKNATSGISVGQDDKSSDLCAPQPFGPARLDVSGFLVHGTSWWGDGTWRGAPIVIAAGKAELRSVALHQPYVGAIAARGDAVVAIHDVLVDERVGTVSAEKAAPAILVAEAARLSIRGAWLHKAADMAVAVTADGKLLLTDTVVQHRYAGQRAGATMQIDGDARLAGVRIHNAAALAVEVNGKDADLRAVGLRIDPVNLGPNKSFGVGLQVIHGGRASLFGSRVRGARRLAVGAFHPATRLRIAGSAIVATRPNAAGKIYAYGIGVLDSQGVDIVDSLIDGNGGVALSTADASTRVRGTVIANTHPLDATRGKEIEDRPADGLAAKGPGLELERSLVLANKRAGLFLNKATSVVSRGNIVTRGYLGVQCQDCSFAVDEANLVIDNAHNRNLDKQLTLPPPPSPIPAK